MLHVMDFHNVTISVHVNGLYMDSGFPFPISEKEPMAVWQKSWLGDGI